MPSIKNLILQGEGVRLDFKKTITSKEKIAKSLVAFANNKGGKLLIGVADDGSIKGVKSEEEEKYMILTASHQFCKPAIEPFFEEIYVDDKLVLVVNIPESETKPHYALDDQKKWWAYVRIEDKSVLASKIIVEVLKQDHLNKGVLITYSDNEKKLLEYLSANEKITLKEFSKMLRCSFRKAQKILVSLILTNVIRTHTSEKGEFFTAVK
ncbi:AlbA family DNA-binding domain-containing protein [Pedobacter mucosus]|uniref:AlbA family DNA-binding domain-containing protein n=1 Tax=Pedobacter mucosus TaxID=2895286 RepID=UPI001EE3FADF|nr:ATP-binding protein [Pedobacter mucosus]UKT65517.1 ATP-binding protein [Pedobacter mucosus]